MSVMYQSVITGPFNRRSKYFLPLLLPSPTCDSKTRDLISCSVSFCCPAVASLVLGACVLYALLLHAAQQQLAEQLLLEEKSCETMLLQLAVQERRLSNSVGDERNKDMAGSNCSLQKQGHLPVIFE
jgi:hypothetical protein